MPCHSALDLLQNTTLPSQQTSPIAQSPMILLFAGRGLIHKTNSSKTAKSSFIHPTNTYGVLWMWQAP